MFCERRCLLVLPSRRWGPQRGNLLSLQTSEDAVLKWSEKQKIVYSGHPPAGAKKGEGLPVTAGGRAACVRLRNRKRSSP